MNWKNEILEVIELQKEYKLKRSKAKSAYKKFKNKINYFYFLDVILSPKKANNRNEDDLLEVAIKDLLNSIGIKSIIPLTKKDVDIKSKFKRLKFGIEVKNGNFPSENDLFQAHKYAIRAEREYHPLVIWNNTTTNQEFDSSRILDAELNKYGIMTTKELYKGYIKLKRNQITFDNFINQINKSGIIKFSNKSLKTSL